MSISRSDLENLLEDKKPETVLGIYNKAMTSLPNGSGADDLMPYLVDNIFAPVLKEYDLLGDDYQRMEGIVNNWLSISISDDGQGYATTCILGALNIALKEQRQQQQQQQQQQLNQHCEEYKTHLENEIVKEAKKVCPVDYKYHFESKSGSGYEHGVSGLAKVYTENKIYQKSENLTSLVNKYNAINNIQKTLHDVNSKDKIKEFKKSIENNYETLSRSRDSYFEKFMKVVATIFSLSLAHYVGEIWNVKGEKTIKKMEDVIGKKFSSRH